MRNIHRFLIAAAILVGSLAPQASAQTDFSKIEIKTTKITNNFYTLEGSGGMTGALIGPDGVLLVDSQFAPLTEKIVAAVKAISTGQIRYLINTHVHGDHTGGNENFGKLGYGDVWTWSAIDADTKLWCQLNVQE